MWNVLICDDQREQCGRLKELLGEDPELRVSCCTSTRELVEICAARRPDILLMDICLGEESGIELVKCLTPETAGVQVIYVTGYVEYCTKVYETEHISFLLKPVDRVELLRAVTWAKERLVRRRTEGLTLQTKSAVYFLPFAGIRYLESQGRLVRCVTDHGTCESYARLSELEGQLNDRFFQCHKSFVVNMDRVTAFASTCFTLSTGERIPVSTRRRAEARLRFLQSLKEGFPEGSRSGT